MKRSKRWSIPVPENNSPEALDIYARVEDMLGLQEASEDLYAYYIDELQRYDFATLLDVGCGRGAFLGEIGRLFPHVESSGLDKSAQMVSMAKKSGLNVECQDIAAHSGSYDVITAVFDVLNYIEAENLAIFFSHISRLLAKDGLFMCDINTMYGFEEIAVGAFSAGDESRFVSIDSDFDGEIYTATFDLFELKESGCWERSTQRIYQYFHNRDHIVGLSKLELVRCESIALYADMADKEFLVFKKG